MYYRFAWRDGAEIALFANSRWAAPPAELMRRQCPERGDTLYPATSRTSPTTDSCQGITSFFNAPISA